MTRAGLIVAALVFAGAGCAGARGGDAIGATEEAATPIDRMLIGEAARYPADETLRAQLGTLDSSMAARREAAWSVVARVLAPSGAVAGVGVAEGLTLPRFSTWYSREDFLPMFDRLFRGLNDDQKKARAPFSDAQLRDVFPWEARMAPTLASYTRERYEARVRELATPAGERSLGGDPRVVMSPAYVEHLLADYAELTACVPPPGSAAPLVVDGATNDAPCLAAEFPADAVAVKARWIPDSLPLRAHDTSAAALTRYLASGTFDDGEETPAPGEDAIYSMRLTPDTTVRLAALHIATKELRDWMWITLWWSPSPDEDFGADRPESVVRLGGPWKNYKMCVVTGYVEGDARPGAPFRDAHPTLADALDAAAASGPSTWCSNPYLELGPKNARTNCIGCHQHGGTGASTESVLAGSQDPRAKVRANFPTDYAFTTSTGLDLAGSMTDTMTALTPP